MTDFISIPFEQLSEEALQGVLEEFIYREGTEYGEQEYTSSDKKQQLILALKQQRAEIVFDPVLESCTLIEVK